MQSEPLLHRAIKWVTQQVTGVLGRGDQHDRLNDDQWDIVIVLDSCRWDTIRDAISWPINSAYSPASATPEWLSEAEKTGVLKNTHIVSGNVQYESASLEEAEMHKIWETDWNDRLGTVLPEPILSKANHLLENGNKPVVAHLVPPHTPYVAKIDDTWFPVFPKTEVWKHRPDRKGEKEKVSPQAAMSSGIVDTDRARKGYEASVKSTFKEVETYISKWVNDGHTVILTADHGEAHGRISDFGLYGHPSNCHIKPLIEVPYEKFEKPESVDGTEDTVTEKLAALGYMEDN